MRGREFTVERIDYIAAGVKPGIRVSCIARAGSTEEYAELGPVESASTKPVRISHLAADRPLRFRFIFYRPGEPQLVAYCDGVRAEDDAGKLGSSLVDIEPAILGGPIWKLVLPEEGAGVDKPNVLVERSVFPTAQSAVRHPWFGVLVIPEVMRQVATAAARQPDALDDSGSWLCHWSEFIDKLDVDRPAPDLDDAAQQSWVDEVVQRFTMRPAFREKLAIARAEMEGAE